MRSFAVLAVLGATFASAQQCNSSAGDGLRSFTSCGQIQATLSVCNTLSGAPQTSCTCSVYGSQSDCYGAWTSAHCPGGYTYRNEFMSGNCGAGAAAAATTTSAAMSSPASSAATPTDVLASATKSIASHAASATSVVAAAGSSLASAASSMVASASSVVASASAKASGSTMATTNAASHGLGGAAGIGGLVAVGIGALALVL